MCSLIRGGRKLGQREEIDIDLDAVIREARLRNVALEIDSQPERLDLDDTWARRGKDAGVLLAVDSDAHDANQLRLVRYGVATARRGWAERRHVLNALPPEVLLANSDRIASRRKRAGARRARRTALFTHR
jgi:DNA polymerase (family X)